MPSRLISDNGVERVYELTNASGVVTGTLIEPVTIPAEAVNKATLEKQAETALANNRTYLAIGTPTTAQNTAQVKALTRQNNAIMRLLLGLLDGTD